jgi:hypothetical protein
MLDALLAALPDAAYFEQRSFGEDMREKLRAEDVPFAGYLRGAAVWDLVAHPAYPVYSISKTNTEDNQGLHMGYGNAVLSSVETGELLILPMKDESGKMPMAERPKPVRLPSHLPRAKTYSVDDLWKTFKVDDLCGGYGSYQAFLRAGNFQSRPYPFKAVSDPKKPHARPFEAVLKAKGAPGENEFGIPGASFSAAPGAIPPKEPGLALVHGKPYSENGIHHFPVSGSFRFAGEWPKDAERLPLHILIAERNDADLAVRTLWLPRAKCHFHDGAYTGHLNFDLANLFPAGDGVSKPPKEAWISTVHRGWQGPIAKVDFAQIP